MFDGFPVEVSPAFEGERIRSEDLYVEFGGPKMPHKFELVRVRPMDRVEDNSVKIVGPDVSELKEKGLYPLGILVEVAGAKLETDLEPVVERRIHLYANYVEGFMHLNQRYDIWLRLGRKAFKKGLTSLRWVGLALIKLFKAEMPYIEKMQVTFITDPETVGKMYDEALKIYEGRDAKVRGMKDEDVDTFYGCVLCQSFAPTHVCTITPQRISFCGALTWLDARAAANIDPKGPNFPMPKGRCLDPVRGEYDGVNEMTAKKSLGSVKRVYLYSMFGYPMTSCGCFECIAFYIPEVDGIGIVHRPYKQPTINGLTFATMAAQTGGGIQAEGFLGVAVEFLRSKKFFAADGGWGRIAWLPAELKERVKDAIPEELREKVATDRDVKDIDELKRFLVEKGHPLGEKLKEAEAKKPPEVPVLEEVPAIQTSTQTTTAPVVSLPLGVPAAVGVGGFKLTLHDAKIRIRKITVKK